jgi:hypothetical protein
VGVSREVAFERLQRVESILREDLVIRREAIESIVDDVLDILAHANLTHDAIFVSIETRQLTDVREDVLQTIRQLKRIDITQPILYVRVDDQLRETEDLTHQMECITKSRLLTLLRRERVARDGEVSQQTASSSTPDLFAQS